MADKYILQITDTSTNIEAGTALDNGQIALCSNNFSMYAKIGGDVYEYKPLSKNGSDVAVTVAALSCTSLTSTGAISGTTGTFTSSITGNSLSVTTTMQANSATVATLLATSTVRTNTIEDYSGGEVQVDSDIGVLDSSGNKILYTVGGSTILTLKDYRTSGTDVAEQVWSTDAGGFLALRVSDPTASNPDWMLQSNASEDIILKAGQYLRIDNSDVLFDQNTTLAANTADGSDDQENSFCGGGDAVNTRGAFITAKGNENTAGGDLLLSAGNTSTSSIQLFTGVSGLTAAFGYDKSFRFYGSGVLDGNLDLDGIPTSDPAHAGRVWNDSGTLKISAG